MGWGTLEVGFRPGASAPNASGSTSSMLELEQALNQLDAQSATLLERLVRDALALVRQKITPSGEVDAKGWLRLWRGGDLQRCG